MADGFDDIALGGIARANARRAAALAAATQTSPDTAARDQRYAAALGVPVEAVAPKAAEAGQQLAMQSAVAATDASPALHLWSQDPNNASLGIDHMEDLSGIGGLLKVAFGAADRGFASNIRGVGEGSAAMARLQGDPMRASTAQAQAAQYLDPIAAYFDRKGIARTPTNPTLLQKGAQLAGGIVPYVLSGFLAPLTAFTQGVDQVAQDAKAKGKSGAAVDLAELGAGGAQAALMALPVAKVAEGLVPTMKSALVTSAAKLGIGTAATATVVGGGMQVATNVAEKLAVDPGKDLGEGVPESMATMGLLHAVTAAPGVIADVGARSKAATDAGGQTTAFNAAADAVRAAPLTARSPDRLRDLMEGMASGEKVYLPADAVRTYLQADGDIGPFVKAGVGDQVGAAVATGADVVLPASDYLAHIAPSDAHPALAKELRLSADGMSAREADDFDKNFQSMIASRGDDLAREAQASAEAAAPMQRVFDDVQRQAREAGYGADVARQYGALFAARYETRAARFREGQDDDLPDGLKGDAWTEYQRAATGGGVRLSLEMPEAIRKEFDRVDVLIDALRAERSGTASRGNSLLDYVSKNGGLDDTGGEFKAIDAEKWHVPRENGGVRFRRRLLRDDGRTAGDMAEKAWEAGYFPDATERPDHQALVDAVREELAGRPRYVNQIDRQRVDFKDAADALEQVLAERGVDLGKATNAEIKALLTRATDGEPAGRTLDQATRGSISFGDGAAVIRLFEDRDLSTLLHEWGGHAFLEELKADAAREDAPESVKRDWEITRRALGIGDGDISTEAHETWARSFEAYLMEGKAPSEGLRGAFQRFRAWLVAIYRQVKALGVTVSPDLRDVFDRLLATDGEIASAHDRAGLKIADPKLMGMSEAEGAAYRDLAERATGDAQDALLAKLMAQVRRRRTAEWAQERERTAGEAEEALAATPLFGAVQRLLGKGERVRLDAQAIIDHYGTDTVLDQLPRAVPPVYAREGGVHPDELADRVGYGSGEAMLNDLMAQEADRRTRAEAKDTRSIRRRMLDDETDRLMAERHGDLMSDGSIEEEGMRALHNEKAGELLASELRAIGRKAKDEITPLNLVQRWAADFINDRRYADLQPHVYLRAERKAAGEFERALIAGHDAQALAAKQRQAIAHVLFRESSKAREASDAIVSRLNRLADKPTLRSMDQDYLDRIHELLERFDFKPATQKELRRRASFAAWAAEREAAGEVILASPEMLAGTNAKHFTGMSVGELQGLADTVDNLAHLGRLKKKLLVLKDQRDFDDMLGEVEARTADLHDIARERTSSDHEKRNRVREFDLNSLKIETLVDWLDGRDVNGPLNKMLIRPGQDAQLEANNLRDSVLHPLSESYAAVPRAVRRTWRNRVDVPELIDPATGEPFKMDRRAVLAMALNSGTESNWRKLLDGYGWSEADAKAVMDRVLTKSEWDFVQAAWDHVGKLWPKIAATERKLTGVVPEKIETRSVQTPHGEYAGGYWPAVYDPTRTPELARARRDNAADLFNKIHVTAATRKGFTESRTEFTGPMLLSPEAVLFKHLNEVTTRLAYAEWLRSAKRLIESDRFRKVVETKIGPEAYGEFMPWLQRQVGYRLIDPKALNALDSFWRAARINVTTSVAAVNPVVWAEHASAFPQSVSVLGWSKFGDGMMSYLSKGGPFGSAQFIYARSEMMRQRMAETSRDQRDMMDRMRRGQSLSQRIEDKTGLPVGWAAHIPELAHFPVSWINQHVVAFPTWLGGYRGALRDGLSEEDAIAAGDKAVRISHSSGAAMNLSAIQDPNNEFMKLGTMFFGYRNTQYQLQRSLIWDASHAKSAGDVGRVLNQGLLLLIVTPILAAVVTGKLRGDHTPEEYAEIVADECFRALWGGVAFGRDIADAGLNVVEGKRPDYELSPIGRSFEEAWLALKDVSLGARKAYGDEDAEPSDKWLKHIISAPGIFLGWPLSPIGRAAQYAKDVHDGREEPKDVGEAAAGLAFGPTKH